MNCRKCKEMRSPRIVPDSDSEDSDIIECVMETDSGSSDDEEEYIPPTVGRVNAGSRKFLALAPKGTLSVDKLKASKKGPFRVASDLFLGLPLKDKQNKKQQEVDDNMMQAPLCARMLMFSTPGRKRKREEMEVLCESP